VEIIRVDQEQKWNERIQSMHEYDFYHQAAYHRLDLSGEAFLLYFRNARAAFALPVIVRNIEGTAYKDITSVYGYAGPLSRDPDPAPEDIRCFHEELKHYMDANEVVSAFARLHPLFEDQTLLLKDVGEVSDTNLTVVLDLHLPPSVQRSQYASSLKNDINRLERIGIIIQEAKTKEDIDIFAAIYRETMRRVKASERYWFPNQYFYDFLSSIPSVLFLAYYKDIPISGSLFTVCNGIIQTHLSATKDAYLRLSPLKYIWDQIRIMGNSEKLSYMHLGGGHSGKNDSLFQFKSQFSSLRRMFKVWKYIHNPQVYEALIQEKHSANLADTTFFPLYRKL
jgi:hypothetical protein